MDSKVITHKLRDRPVVLVGMMGCGKSHVAKILGETLDLDVFDSDVLVEKEEGKTISEIFEQDGEQYFRDLEAKKVLELLDHGACIISTGGGALMRNETLNAIDSKSVSIWINTDIDILLSRVSEDDNRPLLSGVDAQQKLLALLEERLPQYSQADIYVENNGDVSDAIEEIERALAEYL